MPAFWRISCIFLAIFFAGNPNIIQIHKHGRDLDHAAIVEPDGGGLHANREPNPGRRGVLERKKMVVLPAVLHLYILNGSPQCCRRQRNR